MDRGGHYFWLGASAETDPARYTIGEITGDTYAAVFDRAGECFCLIDPSDCVGGIKTALARAQDIADMFNGGGA